jgi:hypothetical protein
LTRCSQTTDLLWKESISASDPEALETLSMMIIAS